MQKWQKKQKNKKQQQQKTGHCSGFKGPSLGIFMFCKITVPNMGLYAIGILDQTYCFRFFTFTFYPHFFKRIFPL